MNPQIRQCQHPSSASHPIEMVTYFPIMTWPPSLQWGQDLTGAFLTVSGRDRFDGCGDKDIMLPQAFGGLDWV
jgi:hypothetical protein